MKRIALVLAACFFMLYAHAAYLKNVPKTLTQPDGTVLHCFASGDEFFNYLHDANGYTIIQHPVTGYFVYADKQDGKLVATDFIAGKYDPASKGLQPYALISPEQWLERRKAWAAPDIRPKNRDFVPNHGVINNIAIFIRFSDDTEFTNSYSSIDNKFNDLSGNSVSMRSYFQAASYGAIDIPTTFYPEHNDQTIISYHDTYPRSYFQPYNASTNPNGYQDDERAEREFSLLERAVNYVNQYYPIPTDLNIDYDNDGFVDNVCFIVKGDVGAWNSLLWPHKSSLYDRQVTINGKRVYDLNMQFSEYLKTATFCHEMNHTLSAPDLYHYSSSGPSPVGIWDLMASHYDDPQLCGAYMKYKYGHWIDEIPEITQAGSYTLNPISSSSPTNIAYKIASENPNQFYILEYRDNTSTYEYGLPGSGLLIYRIDTRFDGNASYDPSNNIYDEIYIFRPDGTNSNEGDLYNAHFSSNVGRTEFSSSTNPYPFLTDGSLDDNIRIFDISTIGNTISFKYSSTANCEPPTNPRVNINGRDLVLTWEDAIGATSYNIYRDGILIANTSATSFNDNSLCYGDYNYYIKSIDSQNRLSTASVTTCASIQPLASNLAVSKNGNNAELSWTIPEQGNPKTPSTTLTHGNQINNGTSYSWSNLIRYWGHRHLAGNISAYNGLRIYNVDFYANNPGTYQLNIFEGTTTNYNTIPRTQVYCQSISVTASGWNTIDLTEPYYVNGNQDLWIFINNAEAIENLTVYLCQDEGNDEGVYYTQDPTWYTFHNATGLAFLIKAHLTDGVYTYNLYDGTAPEPIASNISGTSYSVSNITENTAHQYTIKTNYYAGETEASNMAGLTIGTTSIPSLELASNDKMTITEGSKLTVSGALSNNDPEHLILEDGAQLVNNSGGVYATVKKNITAYTPGTKDGWNLIASPITEVIAPTIDNGLLANSYDLYTFDQSQDQEWRNYEAQAFDISNKTGYLYANSANTTLTFSGTLAGAVEATPLAYDDQATYKGFNLIGNPYPCNAYVTGRSFYVLQDNATTHQSEFILGENPIPPCAAILVEAQNGGESVTYSKTAPDASPAPQGLTVTVSKANLRGEGLLDKARISFNEGERLTKFNRNAEGSRLYIPQGGHDFAVACTNGENEMPLNFKAAENGSYTLTIKVDGMDLAYLYLIDNMTGENIDLLAAGPSTGSGASYTFEANTKDYASRFKLVFAPMDGPSTSSGAFAYYANGEIIITGIADACNASLQIVDMMGHIVCCRDGVHTVSTIEMTPGVYVLRLIDGENVRTQKIIIE